MKKLLSILGTVTLTATTASSVIACGGIAKPVKQPKPVVEPQTTIASKEDINKEK